MMVANPVLAQCPPELVHADVLLGHVRLDDLPIMDQQAGLPLNEAPKSPVAARHLGNQIIQHQQRTGYPPEHTPWRALGACVQPTGRS